MERLTHSAVLALCLAIAATALRAAEDAGGVPEGAGEALETLRRMAPLTPEEIRDIRGVVDAKGQAARQIHAPDSARITSLVVSTEPGSPTPRAEILHGFALALELVDATGAPWPITSHTVGDPEGFRVQVPEVEPSNLVTASVLRPHAATNLLLTLAGRSTPVAVTLVAVAGRSDYTDRISLVVGGRGPLAAQPVGSAPLPRESGDLLSVLDGLSPEGARALEVEGAGGVRAWESADGTRVWLRTALDHLSPAPLGQIAAPGGTRAYELPSTRTAVLADDAGRLVTVKLLEGD